MLIAGTEPGSVAEFALTVKAANYLGLHLIHLGSLPFLITSLSWETAAEICFHGNVFLVQTPLNGFQHKPGSRATKTAVSGLTIYPVLVVSGPTYLGLISDDLASRSGQFIYLSKNDAVCHVRHILFSF
jgi:hypothetical protein